jgi:hypothetical protein
LTSNTNLEQKEAILDAIMHVTIHVLDLADLENMVNAESAVHDHHLQVYANLRRTLLSTFLQLPSLKAITLTSEKIQVPHSDVVQPKQHSNQKSTTDIGPLHNKPPQTRHKRIYGYELVLSLLPSLPPHITLNLIINYTRLHHLSYYPFIIGLMRDSCDFTRRPRMLDTDQLLGFGVASFNTLPIVHYRLHLVELKKAQVTLA